MDAERMCIYLARNLDDLAEIGLPPWVQERRYRLAVRPDRRRYTSGDVLVYSQRNDNDFSFIGVLRGARMDRDEPAINFIAYEPFSKPVLVYSNRDGVEVDNCGTYYVADKGWFNEFSYLPEAAFQSVLAAAGALSDPSA